MQTQPCFRLRRFLVTLLLAIAAVPAAQAVADTVWLKSPGAKTAVKYDNVKIERVDGNNLLFTSESGNEARKPLEQVSQIAMDDEPALTTAETAFQGGDFAGAIDGYRKAATASARPWVRQRAALRLIEAGSKAPDFGAAVAGFATLATIDSDAAGKAKPPIPAGATKSVLTGAIRDVQNAEQASGIKPDGARVLLNFQIELQTAAHDTDGASAALKQLAKLGGGPAPVDSTPGTPATDNGAVVRARAEEKLNEARVALAQKDYKHASEVLTAAGEGIVDPQQQDEAMFMLAEAKAALASDDPKALMDAGILYMRVVANFGKVDGAPHIVESLMKTAAIEEKLSKPEEALRIYNEVASAYKDSSSAQDAATNAARISAALKPKG